MTRKSDAFPVLPPDFAPGGEDLEFSGFDRGAPGVAPGGALCLAAVVLVVVLVAAVVAGLARWMFGA